MIAAEPILTVLLFSALAASAAGLGVLPAARPGGLRLSWLGCAGALASGFMLGAGYILMAEAIGGAEAIGMAGVIGMAAPLPPVLGAVLGVAYTYLTHRFSGAEEIDTLPEARVGDVEEYRLLLLFSLHSAPEGIAIGAAMAVNLHLGIFMASALAIHNIAEAMTLNWVLLNRRVSLGHSAALGVFTNVPQVLMALVSFAILSAARSLVPWTLGFAAGAMVYLVLTELLPASYKTGEHTRIALLVSFSAGGLVLLEGFWR